MDDENPKAVIARDTGSLFSPLPARDSTSASRSGLMDVAVDVEKDMDVVLEEIA